MSYDIELMGLGEDIYPLLQRSADALNRVQSEFKFHLTPVSQRPSGISFQRSEYLTTNIWDFLREQKKIFGGNRPNILAFVTKPLRSPRTRNLFGSHEASGDERLAVATTFGTGQYVKEESRYCCYYMARYCLSFVNPLIKSHEDDARKDCYFHYKRRKADIRASMDSAKICDSCMAQIENPMPGSEAKRLSREEQEALKKMRLFVSGDLPHSIVMKGGGVKGLAFAGALLEIEEHYYFDQHVGTSAGAIAAVLLAASYTPAELKDLLLTKNFRDFMDAPFWRIPINLLFSKGAFPGEAFRLWIADLLTRKTEKIAEVRMSDLNRAVIYACRPGEGTLLFESAGERSETVASFAVRCSMSIPIFFFPSSVDDRRVYDGGIRNNFPLDRFVKDHPESPFIALYLGRADNRNRRWFGSELLDIIVEGEERETVDRNRRDVVVIDTSPVGTVDFGLTAVEKDFLLSVGKAAALEFLFRRKLDNGPNQGMVEAARSEAEEKRKTVRRERSRRRLRRLIFFPLALGLISGVTYLAWAHGLLVWRALSSLF